MIYSSNIPIGQLNFQTTVNIKFSNPKLSRE